MNDGREAAKPFRHPGHRLVTRRDFLAQGLIRSSAFALTPSILALLLRSEEARAGLCDDGSGGSVMPAVLIFDHAGGAGLLQQTLPLSVGDQPLTAKGYAGLGMNASQAPVASIGSVLDDSWGIRFHKNLGFVQALNATAIPAAKALVTGFATVASLNDDSSGNMTNPAQGLALLGALGDSDRRIAAVIGTSASTSGGNSAAAVSAPLYTATQVRSASAAANLVSTGQLAARLGNDKDLAAKVISAMQKMSQGQLARFSSQDLPKQAAQLVQCGYVKASAMTGTPQPGVPGLDPSQNTLATSVFDFTNGNEQQAATLTYLLAMGFSGVATLELGGRDYHDGTRTTGETSDSEAATLTAKAINLYHRLITEQGARPRPLMIIHLTDGGVNASDQEDAGTPGFFTWDSDRGTANGAYVMMYDPAGKPKLARNQLGYSTTDDGGVDIRNAATPFSTNAVALAEVFMINYLQLAGQSPGNISQAFPSMVLSAGDIAKYAVTAKAGS